MNKSIHLRQFFRMGSLVGVLALFTIMQACTDEMEQATVDSGKGETATLELLLSVPPMLETKAMICEADSGSEACKAGFYYEMQVLTTDTVHTDSLAVATKAASSLKNVYAFLFKSDGAFNGRASLSTANISTDLSLEFSNIADASAANGRLVIVANDNSATVNYASSTAFANFSGTYAAFQNLTLTSAVTTDANIPYVGSATVSLSGGAFTAVPAVQLYRMLAKIVLTNSTFSITGGPTRNSINLYNAGNKYFGTPNNYDGTGSTVTASGRYLTTATAGNNASSNTWYVGENVQTANANAAYIEFGTTTKSVTNTSPSIGQEYIASGGYAFKYKVYLKNTALRRNNVYNVTVSMSGTLDDHIKLAANNGNVDIDNTVVHGGLNIGKFGGASSYTTGTGSIPTISGSYTKNLLIQPNTSGTTTTDNVTRQWSNDKAVTYQSDTRKYWDHTYTTANIDKSANTAYEYCYNLTIGNVNKGTWYFPTNAQLRAIWGVFGGLKINSSFADYSAFYGGYYWSSTENSSDAWCVNFSNGYSGLPGYKPDLNRVRCVRDL